MRRVIIPFMLLIMILQLNMPMVSLAETLMNSTNSADDRMKVAIAAYCDDYNKVGNEWSWTIAINGKPIKAYQTISIHAGDFLHIVAHVEEYDKKYSDVGEGETTIIVNGNDIANGFEARLTVTVVENGGVYKNNKADWTIVCSFTN